METANLKKLIEAGTKELAKRHVSLSSVDSIEPTLNRTTNGHHGQTKSSEDKNSA